MNRVQSFIARLFRIIPASEKRITIIEPHSFRENVIRNKIWYHGDSAELEQFFQKTAKWDVEQARFWAAHASGSVRKIHSGIVQMVIDRYRDIVLADLDGVEFDDKDLDTVWADLYKKSKLNDVLGEAISDVLASGDGAFKITADQCSKYPIVEFYDAEDVDYVYEHATLKEVKFYTSYWQNEKEFRLEETYGFGYVLYKLYDNAGKEMPLQMFPETAHLIDFGISGDLMLAVPMKFLNSTKYKKQKRGKALFEGKTDVLDGLDEVISQWIDAIRMGRIKRYIPDNLIPRDQTTGELLPANPFDNDFIAIGDNMSEKANQQVEISQPQISYEAYVSSYSSFLDMVLQGVMSPATLGIDLKKTDNAEAQREKEKVTLHVRNKIVDALNEVLPELFKRILQCCDLMQGKEPGKYEVAVKFGEYASPDFDTTVDTVGKAKQYGIMSLETSVDQLYGDTWTDAQKQEEVQRLKEEQGIAAVDVPDIRLDAGDFHVNEGDADESKGKQPNVQDESKGVPGSS